MKAGNSYRHISMIDLELHVFNIQYAGRDYIKLKVKYWNPNYSCYCFPTPETVKIQREKLWKWKQIGQ